MFRVLCGRRRLTKMPEYYIILAILNDDDDVRAHGMRFGFSRATRCQSEFVCLCVCVSLRFMPRASVSVSHNERALTHNCLLAC